MPGKNKTQLGETVMTSATVTSAGIRPGRYFTWSRNGWTCIIEKVYPEGHRGYGQVATFQLNEETGVLASGGLVAVSESTGVHDPAPAAELVGALNLCRTGQHDFPYDGSVIKWVARGGGYWAIAGGPMDPSAA